MGTPKPESESPARKGTTVKTVSLPPALVDAVEGRVAIGEFRNFSEATSFALRDLLKNNPPISSGRGRMKLVTPALSQ